MSVRLTAGGRVLAADPERSILSALAEAGVTEVDAPCGGRGRCGKCAVSVTGPVRSLDTGLVRRAEGERLLACRYAPAGDCVLELRPDAGLRVVTEGAGGIPPGGAGLGAAVDIGTTTVAVLLYDLASGRPLGAAGQRNAQRSWGADVISRITACAGEGLPLLRDAVRTQIAAMVTGLCREAGRDPGALRAMSVAGNTVMEHICAGLDPTGIGVAPFTPVSLFGDDRPGWAGLPAPYMCPCVSGYVGGDITAGLLAAGGDETEGLTLYVDIGTNGEMALGDRNGYLTCATAAGPAFEGAEIACGMDGAPGAIDRVRAGAGDILVHVIGGGEPAGLCGSGLIDAVAALLTLGVIDETGRLADPEELPSPLADRWFRLEDGTGAFRLGGGVYLAARDVRQVQLAKAAIRAGADTLLARRGARPEDIRSLVIAGGFGSFMDRDSALRIGLLPPVDPGRIRHAGNAAAAGAALALTPEGRERLARFTEKLGYLELSTARDFMDRYIDSMMFGGDADIPEE